MELVIGIVACLLFVIFTYYTKIFNLRGCITAFILGTVILRLTDLYWLILLIFFVLINYIVTIYKIDEKRKRSWGIIESVRNEHNILANGLVPILIVFLSFFIKDPIMKLAYITSIASASSDTFASEIGILSDKVVLITNFKRVKPGTDGGISPRGELAALLGAFSMAFFGWFLLFKLDPAYGYRSLLYPTAFGFLGCQIDSILGSLFERKNYLNKGEVNLISITVATTLSIPFLAYL